MLGWIRWDDGRRIRLEQELILGVPFLTLYLPRRERGVERRVRKGARLLIEGRTARVLTPPEFEWWPVLQEQGLRSLNTQALRCVLAPAWVRAVFTSKDIRPEQAVLCLKGMRESSDMAQVARELCSLVRNLVIDVPGGGTLAVSLQREFGLPVLPVGAVQPDLILSFASGPCLEGAQYSLKGAEFPLDCEILPLISALWECGRVKTEDIVLNV